MEVVDRVAKLEHSVGGGAPMRVGLSSILSGGNESPDAPIDRMDDICARINMLERLQWLAEERGSSRAWDGGFDGIGGGDFDSTRAWVRMNMLDDSFGTFVDGWSVFDIMPSCYMNSDEYATSVRHKGVAGMKNIEGSILTSIQNELPFMLAGDGSDAAHDLVKVKTYKDYCSDKGTGICTKILDLMDRVKLLVTRLACNLRNEPALQLSTQMMEHTLLFIERLIKFINEQYLHLMCRGGFSSQDAWNLLSKLIRCIFEDMTLV